MSLRTPIHLIAGLVLVVGLAGCGGDGEATPPDPTELPAVGGELFAARVVGSNPGCVTCHSLEEGVNLVGPSLYGLADRAGDRVPGVSARDYVRESITAPDAFVVDGYSAGQMVGDWDKFLTDQQIESVVDFLLADQ